MEEERSSRQKSRKSARGRRVSLLNNFEEERGRKWPSSRTEWKRKLNFARNPFKEAPRENKGIRKVIRGEGD